MKCGGRHRKRFIVLFRNCPKMQIFVTEAKYFRYARKKVADVFQIQDQATQDFHERA